MPEDQISKADAATGRSHTYYHVRVIRFARRNEIWCITTLLLWPGTCALSYACHDVSCLEVGANVPWENLAVGTAAPPTRKTASQNTRPCAPSPFAGLPAAGCLRRTATPANQNFSTDSIENSDPPEADPPEAPNEVTPAPNTLESRIARRQPTSLD